MSTKKSPSKPRRPSSKKADAQLVRENKELKFERDGLLEREAATSDILRMIARSPTDLQSVLDGIVERAARLCDAEDAAIFRLDGNFLRLVAHFGPIPMAGAVGETVRVLNRDTPAGRAIIDRKTIHVHDLRAADAEFPEAKARGIAMGLRTVLDAPLLREGVAIGAIHIRRREVRPFSDRQIKLLETFADQAVIAIENARLFQELKESLEHQTATSEVLGIISRSPTDVQPVLDAIVESAARVCGIDDVVLRLRTGDVMGVWAHFGSIPIGRIEISIDDAHIHWIREHGTLHVRDALEQNDFPTMGSGIGYHTHLSVPLRQQGEFIGMLTARRMEVRPFTPAQIKLLETFADQAVIAIENVRLFNELKEALEQQTATSEILGVIARSPTDVQPVLDTVAENAARLCDATDAVIYRADNDVFRPAASYGTVPVPEPNQARPIERGRIPGRTMIDRRTIHIHDLAAEPEDDLPAPFARSQGVRSALATPLLREGIAIGAIFIRRLEVRPFTDKQIKLLATFASQAVVAIENVRLFKELQDRNRDLTEALEQQTATSEILRVIAGSPTDLQPVLNVVAKNVARLCEATDAQIYRLDGDVLRRVAVF